LVNYSFLPPHKGRHCKIIHRGRIDIVLIVGIYVYLRKF
jgi:hypothetical protein